MSQHFQPKKRKKRKKNDFITLVKQKTKPHLIPLAFVLGVLLLLLVVGSQIKKTHTVYSEVKVLEQKLSQIEQENIELEAQIGIFEDPQIIDQEARQRLNLKKDGENVVVVLPAEKSTAQQQPPQQQEEKKSFWDKFLSKFKNNNSN